MTRPGGTIAVARGPADTNGVPRPGDVIGVAREPAARKV